MSPVFCHPVAEHWGGVKVVRGVWRIGTRELTVPGSILLHATDNSLSTVCGTTRMTAHKAIKEKKEKSEIEKDLSI